MSDKTSLINGRLISVVGIVDINEERRGEIRIKLPSDRGDFLIKQMNWNVISLSADTSNVIEATAYSKIDDEVMPQDYIPIMTLKNANENYESNVYDIEAGQITDLISEIPKDYKTFVANAQSAKRNQLSENTLMRVLKEDTLITLGCRVDSTSGSDAMQMRVEMVLEKL